jgi:hypothetical protein
MSGISGIKEHMEVIGADGVHVGTIDHVEGNRIKLTKADSGEGHHKGHHHFIDSGGCGRDHGRREVALYRSPELIIGRASRDPLAPSGLPVTRVM